MDYEGYTIIFQMQITFVCLHSIKGIYFYTLLSPFNMNKNGEKNTVYKIKKAKTAKSNVVYCPSIALLYFNQIKLLPSCKSVNPLHYYNLFMCDIYLPGGYLSLMGLAQRPDFFKVIILLFAYLFSLVDLTL